MLTRSEQSRINGAKSKGPVSEEGKAKSSKNAIKHNLTARTFLLSNEELSEAQEMIDDYIRRFRPADRVESDLVLTMVAAQYRLTRACAIETGIIDYELCNKAQELEQQIVGHDEDIRKTFAFTAVCEGKALNNILRYQARLERSYHRALKALIALQQQRKNEPEPVDEPTPVESIDKQPPTFFSLPKPEVRAKLMEKSEKFWAEYHRKQAENNAGKNEPNTDGDQNEPNTPAAPGAGQAR